MPLTNRENDRATTPDLLEPVMVVDSWHHCEICGDVLIPGTTALEAPTIDLIQ